MSEVGTKEWTVKDFRSGDVVETEHGPLQKFYVDFEGSPDTYWRRKAGDAPEIGKAYFGTVSEGKFGPMFKKEKPQGGAGSKGTREWKPEAQYDPEKTARIGRAHAQEMAVRVLTAMGTFDGKHGATPHNHIKSWTDWFDQDVNEAAQRSLQAQGVPALEGAASPANPSPEPEETSADDTHQHLSHLLENAGLSPEAASALASFIQQKFSAEQAQRATTGLRDLETQQETLSKARIAYEKATGDTLPSASDDDSIPF